MSKLTITRPCSKQWNEMNTDGEHRFCNTCEKKVHDFSNLNTTQVLEKLSPNATICARVRKNQLVSVPHKNSFSRKLWSRLSLIFGIGAILGSSNSTQAQIKSTKHTEESQVQWKKVNTKNDANASILVGFVTDESGIPLPEAEIQIKGTEIKTSADFNGNFTLLVPERFNKASSILVINFLGFEPIETKLNSTKNFIRIKMKNAEMLLGEVVIEK
jgi:hypothetical protein